MQDRQLYEQILGLQAPWFVERVELKLENGEVHVYLEHRNDAVWHCPERGRESPGARPGIAAARPHGSAELAAPGHLPVSDCALRRAAGHLLVGVGMDRYNLCCGCRRLRRRA